MDTVVKYDVYTLQTEVCGSRLGFFSLSLVYSGKLMPALAEVELHRRLITHSLEYKSIWPELKHVSLKIASALGKIPAGKSVHIIRVMIWVI